jgi:hypothetical protein
MTTLQIGFETEEVYPEKCIRKRLGCLQCYIEGKLQCRYVEQPPQKKDRAIPPSKAIEVTCACGCGRTKMVWPSVIRRGHGRYFSKACAYKARREAVT